jgi:hypothetical protein
VNLVKNFQRLVSDVCEVMEAGNLHEDITVPFKVKDSPQWKLEKVRFMLQYLPETQLNLAFFNPYLRTNRSLYTYRLILRTF